MRGKYFPRPLLRLSEADRFFLRQNTSLVLRSPTQHIVLGSPPTIFYSLLHFIPSIWRAS